MKLMFFADRHCVHKVNLFFMSTGVIFDGPLTSAVSCLTARSCAFLYNSLQPRSAQRAETY